MRMRPGTHPDDHEAHLDESRVVATFVFKGRADIKKTNAQEEGDQEEEGWKTTNYKLRTPNREQHKRIAAIHA